MSCECSKNQPVTSIPVQPTAVWSKGGGTPGSEIWVLSPADMTSVAAGLAQLRVSIDVSHSSANFKSKVVFQTTSDGVSWGSLIDLEASYFSGNRTETLAWYDNGANFKRGIRIGVVADNVTGSNVEMAQIAMVIDLHLK